MSDQTLGKKMTEIDTLVRPFYLRFLHGNFSHEEESVRTSFFALLHQAAAAADQKSITRLFNAGGWRERLSAAWFVGLLKLDGFEDRISDLLLKSETCFAGQGYCFALARLASDSASESLQNYLIRYLPVGTEEYDQEWAIGALHFIDRSKADAISCDPNIWAPFKRERGITNFEVLMKRVDEGWEK